MTPTVPNRHRQIRLLTALHTPPTRRFELVVRRQPDGRVHVYLAQAGGNDQPRGLVADLPCRGPRLDAGLIAVGRQYPNAPIRIQED